MRILKAPLGRFSKLSSTIVSGRLRNVDFDCHGRSYASSSSSAACKLPTATNVRPKLSRDERRTLVESFVSRHRASNRGKFPTLQTIHKEVGGSYYVVRDIFQELRSKSKSSPVTVSADKEEIRDHPQTPACNTRGSSTAAALDLVFPAGQSDIAETETNQEKDPVDVSLTSSDNCDRLSDDVHAIIATDDDFRVRETEKILQNEVESNEQRDEVSDAFFKNTDPEKVPDIKAYDHHKVEGETCVTSHPVSENPKKKTESENSTFFVGQESKQERRDRSTEPIATENKAREGGMETRKKAGSVWNNIMSFAEGIASFWRKG